MEPVDHVSPPEDKTYGPLKHVLPILNLKPMPVVERLLQTILTSVPNQWVVADLVANRLVCGRFAASSSAPTNSEILYMSFARCSCSATMNLMNADLMSAPNLDNKPWVLIDQKQVHNDRE